MRLYCIQIKLTKQLVVLVAENIEIAMIELFRNDTIRRIVTQGRPQIKWHDEFEVILNLDISEPIIVSAGQI